MVVRAYQPVVFFAAVRFAPGDPAVARLGMEATRAGLEQQRKEMGLDRPIPVQYVIWLGHMSRGDLGVSMSYSAEHPVGSLVWERFKGPGGDLQALCFVACMPCGTTPRPPAAATQH